MSKWSKKTFIDHLNQSCESDVAMHCIELVDFSEKTSDEVSWGNGEDFGTMTFRCDSDHVYFHFLDYLQMEKLIFN